MTTTYDKLDTINDSLNDIKTAIIGKGQTPSGNITTYATAIDNIVQSSPVIDSLSITPTTSAQTITAPSGTDGYSPISVSAVTASIDNNIVAENIKKDVTILGVTGSLESGGGSTGKYALLDRVKDDSNNEIGTVCGFFTDANDTEYAVVCLDAQYRGASKQWWNNTDGYPSVTDLPIYSNIKDSNVWEAKETATFNTQKILDYCVAYNYTSTACTHCRSKSFTIDGIIYYGQLPNLIELNDIARHYNELESKDISASSYSSLNFSTARSIWSSSQYSAGNAWYLQTQGIINQQGKRTSILACPILEIPNS